MNMKSILPIVAFATMSTTSSAQQFNTGINMSNLDQTAKPADDFYQFACGGWMKNHPLPPAYSRYGSFDQLGENNNKRVNGILSELLNGSYKKGTIEQKLSDFYKLAMDSARRDKEGVKPVMARILQMEKAKTVSSLFEIQLQMMAYGDNEFFNTYLGADEKNASVNILNISQGGITLGQKEYYLDTDEATTAIRESYKKHIVRMFQIFGFSKTKAEVKMNNVIKLETELAKASKSMAELRDPEANYNKMSLADFDNWNVRPMPQE